MLSVIKRSTILLIPFLLSSLCQGQLILGGGGGGGGGGVTNIATGCGLTGGAITTTGTISEQILTTAHNGTYAILTGDCGKSLTTNTAAAWTIAQAGTTGFEAGKFWIVQNIGSGSLTVTATTSTFYGGATANISGSVLTVPANTGVEIISDGTNYQVFAGSGGSGGAGTLVFQNAGVTTGTASIFNEVNGTGVTCVDTVTTGTNVHQCSGDPAVLAFKTNLQSATNPQICTSASVSGSAYTAACATSLGAYATNQILYWKADVTNTITNPNLNVDTLGNLPLLRFDGTALAIGEIKATEYLVSNDGGHLRIAQAGFAPRQWKCTIITGDPGAASSVLANDNDSPVACSNDTGFDVTVTTVAAWADAGSPTVTPILTGGSGTSVLTGVLTAGTAAWAAGTVNGTPTLHSFSGGGATCSSTPCTIDSNITTAGGTAKYLVVKITGTY